MKVLLTGGNGYIGSNLLRKLINLNYEVDLVVRPKSNLNTISDVIDNCGVFIYEGESFEMVKIFEKSKPEIVIHLAAQFSYNNIQNKVRGSDTAVTVIGVLLLWPVLFALSGVTGKNRADELAQAKGELDAINKAIMMKGGCK